MNEDSPKNKKGARFSREIGEGRTPCIFHYKNQEGDNWFIKSVSRKEVFQIVAIYPQTITRVETWPRGKRVFERIDGGGGS